MVGEYVITDGVLEKYIGKSNRLVIPEGVTRIAASAFSARQNRESAELIEQVEFPKSLKIIGESAFYKCRNLHSVLFQEGLVEIGHHSFEETSLLHVEFPKSLRIIGNSAFNKAIGIPVLELPKGLNKVGSFAFGSANEVVVYDDAPYALEFEADTITVLDAKTGQIKFKVWNCRWSDCEKIWDMFSSAWLPNAEFDFDALDNSFRSFKDIQNRIITAVYRLEYPYKLTDDSMKMYQSFLARNAYKLLDKKIEQRDVEWVRLLIKHGALKANNYEQFSEAVRTTGNTEISALFLEWANNNSDISKKKVGMELTDRPFILWKTNAGRPNYISRYLGEETIVQFPTEFNDTAITGIADVTGETPGNYTEIREITIPDGYTSIGKNAFKGCNNLVKVVLPKSLVSLGNHCFEDCSSLREIILPDQITTIGDYAFAGCKNLTTVVLPRELVRLGSNAFKNCISLHEIELNEKLEVLGPQCFYETPLRKVIYRGKWCYCPEKMCFSYPRYVYSNGKINALGVPETIQMPLSYLDYQVDDIFRASDKELLKGLTIHASGQLKAFPKNVAHFHCMQFSEFVTGLGGEYSERFNKNTDILVMYEVNASDINVQHAIKEGKRVMSEMEFLDMVKKGEAISADVSQAKSEPIEKKVKKSSDKDDPFRPAAIRKNWKYQETEEGTIELTLYKGTDTEVIVPQRVGQVPVESIGAYTFFAASFAFGNVDKKSREQHRKITSVIIPDGVKKIGENAFNACENLVHVELPRTIEEIGKSAFSGCESLAQINIPENAQLGKSVFTDCTSMADNEGFIIYRNVLYGYVGNEKNIEIPEGIKEIQCWSLGLSFSQRETVECVKLPESLEFIDDMGFFDLKGLKSLVLPNHPIALGEGVFMGCEGLADENGYVAVQNILYDYCSDDKEAFLPEGIKRIDVRVFCNNEVVKIHIPESVTEIASDAFIDDDLRRLKTVYGKAGSVAEEFAIKNNKKFEVE